MTDNVSSRDMARNTIMEESVLFRIQQLQKGLLQFTDVTTAQRLLAEHGKDIRYIAPKSTKQPIIGSEWRLKNTLFKVNPRDGASNR